MEKRSDIRFYAASRLIRLAAVAVLVASASCHSPEQPISGIQPVGMISTAVAMEPTPRPEANPTKAELFVGKSSVRVASEVKPVVEKSAGTAVPRIDSTPGNAEAFPMNIITVAPAEAEPARSELDSVKSEPAEVRSSALNPVQLALTERAPADAPQKNIESDLGAVELEVGAPKTSAPVKTPDPAKQPKDIRGTVSIDFGSRIHEDGIDVYTINLSCRSLVAISGEIRRTGKKLSSFLRRELKPLQYHYGLEVAEPLDSKNVFGSISGIVPMSEQGIYKLDSLKFSSRGGSPWRYSGTIKGKSQEHQGLLGTTYTRIFGGKKVVLKVQKSDPLRFNGVRLPSGPSDQFPVTTVSGNFDYDYDTGNWLTNGILLQSAAGDRDKITGSIKWVPDLGRSTNGKGQYEFNLRFNEDRYSTTPDEGEFFQTAADEEAFFSVDGRIPTLSGTIRYKDTFGPIGDDGESVVLASEVLYELDGTSVTDQQLLAFLKLWLLVVGPVNDE